MTLRTPILLMLVFVLAAASFVTRPRSAPRANKPILAGARIPPNVLARVDAACRDCHSDATRYPWYSYLAPVSILVQQDVIDGRRRMNLSMWDEYSSIRRQRYLSEIANQVQDGGMPLPIYISLHPEAALSDADKQAIFAWTQEERARLIAAQVP